ncbi:aldose 1-epimerase [Verminephrobacter eiseniae]|nr:aldose 1-epimerase [Verminephrobacter sp. Larva24]MCW5229842.1 aldose 1-epimerase [Verminephrobacter eiseniae]MCW5291573.1 aldose 1-epimerase [Verminephrobacter eiseniae]MCW8186150.1 aldose 1-epimerase [Verminephrobacter eiseniae]MCW8222904.1 aldose 1-epimerase [Verminephrobacter eiseniae]
MAQDFIELTAGELRLGLSPTVGGSIAHFSREWREAGALRRTHWLRPATVQSMLSGEPLGMGSFPLVPFCNRIRNGSAMFAGREIRMRPNHPGSDSPHPLHGIGWQRPWRTAAASNTQATLQLAVEADAQWPWSFSASQTFKLSTNALTVSMAVTNRDTVPMPAGIGHHPYFPRDDRTRITVRTRAMWEGDQDILPVALSTHEAVARLAGGTAVADLVLDNNFTGWGREAYIEWSDDANGPARSLVMRAQAPLDFFVLYSPSRADHFCAEPVSQCTDWVNLRAEHSAADLGGASLAPGETLVAQFALLPRWS